MSTFKFFLHITTSFDVDFLKKLLRSQVTGYIFKFYHGIRRDEAFIKYLLGSDRVGKAIRYLGDQNIHYKYSVWGL